MKRGFTLIELLVAIAIASVIITLLFNSFLQTTKIVDRIDNTISINTRAALIQHQLEKDIMGAFLPVQAFKEKEKKSAANNKNQKVPIQKKEGAKKKLTKVFYGINHESMLDLLTFITNNPIRGYWGKKTGYAKPKVARIIYRLKEDPSQKNSFTLYRQEGNNLEFKKYGSNKQTKGARSYPLAEGIKELIIKYRVILEPEKENSEKKNNKKQKKEIKFKTFDQWNFEKELPKNIKRPIPNIVDVSLVLWDSKEQRNYSFEFSIPIIPDISEKPIEKPPKEEETKQKLNQQKSGIIVDKEKLQVMVPQNNISGRFSKQTKTNNNYVTITCANEDAQSELLRLLQMGNK